TTNAVPTATEQKLNAAINQNDRAASASRTSSPGTLCVCAPDACVGFSSCGRFSTSNISGGTTSTTIGTARKKKENRQRWVCTSHAVSSAIAVPPTSIPTCDTLSARPRRSLNQLLTTK